MIKSGELLITGRVLSLVSIFKFKLVLQTTKGVIVWQSMTNVNCLVTSPNQAMSYFVFIILGISNPNPNVINRVSLSRIGNQNFSRG